MPRVIKAGDMTQGHCWPPTTPIPNMAKNLQVFMDGKIPILLGDVFLPHPGPCGNQPTHPVATSIGSNDVFVGGIPVVRDGDTLSCGDIANSQGGTIFSNGGGRNGGDIGDEGQTIGFTVAPPILVYPRVQFPHTRTFLYYDENQLPVYSVDGCPGKQFTPEIYTVVTEEGTGKTWKNYPGTPYSINSGAAGIPSYAPDNVKEYIPILEMSVKVSYDFGPYQDLIGEDIRNGIKFDKSSGRIYGSPDSRFENKLLKIKVRNLAGFSQESLVNISLRYVQSCN